MRQDEIDKTQYMPPVQGENTADVPVSQDTMEMPPVDEKGRDSRQESFPNAYAPRSGVRELPPLQNPEHAAKAAPHGENMAPYKGGDSRKPAGDGFFTVGKKRIALVLVGFLLAGFLGFTVAGMNEEKNQQAQFQKLQQEKQMKEREQQLVMRESDLKTQRRQLEEKMKDLEARQKQLEEQSSRAKGRNEQLEESKSTSSIGKFVDKVTGKEAKRQEQTEANKKQSAAADTEIATIRESIQEAQSMLSEVDNQLDKVDKMKNEAEQLKGKLTTAYQENKDTVDTVLSYAKTGAGLLSNWLLK